MLDIHIPPPTPDDIESIKEHLNRLHSAGSSTDDDRELILDTLYSEWRNQQALSYADFKLLWEIVNKMRAELNTYRSAS